jgi:ATP-dependent protease ClpP protease subunit
MNIYFGSKKMATKNSDDSDQDESSEIYRENNHIYFYSEIDRKTVQSLVKLVREAEEYCFITAFKLSIDPSNIPIYLHISSLGGYIYYALIAVDAIRRCRLPIYSIVEGSVASAGTLVSIVCKKRFVCPNAFMMIHQLSSEVFGKMNEITDEFSNLSDVMDVLKKLYMEHTSFSKKKLEKLLKHDIFLNSKKSLKYKLADEIYENVKSPQVESI